MMQYPSQFCILTERVPFDNSLLMTTAAASSLRCENREAQQHNIVNSRFAF